MLLIHTLSRLTFSDQEWKPLLAGFLLHFSACQGFRPRLSHCVHCGKRIPDEGPFFFDGAEGGLCCAQCRKEKSQVPLAPEQVRWMRRALSSGSASWVNTPDAAAPLPLLRNYVEQRMGRRIRSAYMLPDN